LTETSRLVASLVPEKETFLDKAKTMHHTLLQEDTSTAKVLGARAVEAMDGFCLPEGWVLKTTQTTHKRNTSKKSLSWGWKRVTSKTLRKCQKIRIWREKQTG